MKRFLIIVLSLCMSISLASCSKKMSDEKICDVATKYCIATKCSEEQLLKHFETLNVSRDDVKRLTTFINWNEQAKAYLDDFLLANQSGYSKRQLFDILVVENQFPVEQAEYAISEMSVDFEAQALRRAMQYLLEENLRPDTILQRLRDLGFTDEQVQYAVVRITKIVQQG